MNLGLRYEFFGVPHERDGLQGSIDQASLISLGYTSSNLTVVPKGQLYNNDWNNLAPRFGFAYDPRGDGKMAIRGNWGMFYDRTSALPTVKSTAALQGSRRTRKSSPMRPELT